MEILHSVWRNISDEAVRRNFKLITLGSETVKRDYMINYDTLFKNIYVHYKGTLFFANPPVKNGGNTSLVYFSNTLTMRNLSDGTAGLYSRSRKYWELGGNQNTGAKQALMRIGLIVVNVKFLSFAVIPLFIWTVNPHFFVCMRFALQSDSDWTIQRLSKLSPEDSVSIFSFW